MAEAPVKIRVAGLAKSFAGREVLRDIDLDIAAGRRTAIIGPAAAGKSVLMKCLVGLYRPERGGIAIDGTDLTRASGAARAELLRDFGVLFQQGGLFDSLPVWENVAFKLVNRLKVGRAGRARPPSRSWPRSACRRASPISIRRNCPAVCKSALAWHAQLRPNLRSSSLMNPQRAFISRMCVSCWKCCTNLWSREIRSL